MMIFAGLLASLALLANAIMAGLFFAYSVSVMWGFNAANPRSAIDGMQKINIAITNAWFFPNFFGAPVFAILAAITFWSMGMQNAAIAFGAAALAYFVSAFGVTVAINVPMNEALSRESIPADPDAAQRVWADFSGRWTFWNHIRTLASCAAALLCGLAIFSRDRHRPKNVSRVLPLGGPWGTHR